MECKVEDANIQVGRALTFYFVEKHECTSSPENIELTIQSDYIVIAANEHGAVSVCDVDKNNCY